MADDSTSSRKTIFITGGGSGIGRATAVLFAERGWFVGLGDINEAGLAETQALLPGASFATRLDVRDRAAWDRALAEFAQAAQGRIDVVFNNAGIALGGSLLDHSEEEIDRLIAINIRGVINGARAAHPYLARSAPGSCLLNTASASAIYGTGGMSIYSATKFAVRALTEALDTEWRMQGIKVASIMPGFIDTPLLDGTANAASNVSKRESIAGSKLEFTPVEEVAQAAWEAAHGERLHTPVGKTACAMAHAARHDPEQLRANARALMRAPRPKA
ncbi:MAG: SDR family oxidoreductase [Novosphingobium sp.]